MRRAYFAAQAGSMPLHSAHGRGVTFDRFIRAMPLLLLALAACRTPTEITVVVSSDVPCASLGTTAITVGPPNMLGQAPGAEPSGCDAMGTIVLVPSGEKNAQVSIRVVVGIGGQAPADCNSNGGPGCIVAKRTLRFVPHTSLTLPIGLRMACLGVLCAADETCVRGTCTSATIDNPGMCTNATACSDEGLVPDGSLDGGILDASAGAPFDAQAPTTIVSKPSQDIHAIAVDTTTLYYAAGANVIAHPLDGGAERMVHATALGAPRTLAVDDAQNVYWTGASGSLGFGPPGAGNFEMAGMNTAVCADSTGGVLVGDELGNLTLQVNGSPADEYTLGDLTNITAIATDPTYVYWTEAAFGSIGRGLIGSATNHHLMLTGENGAWSIATYKGAVYWTVPTALRHFSVDFALGETLASGTRMQSVMADESGIYWIEPTEGTLKRFRSGADGGGSAVTLLPVTLLTGIVQRDPNEIYLNAIALDATYVYVIDSKKGLILRLAK